MLYSVSQGTVYVCVIFLYKVFWFVCFCFVVFYFCFLLVFILIFAFFNIASLKLFFFSDTAASYSMCMYPLRQSCLLELGWDTKTVVRQFLNNFISKVVINSPLT